MGVERQGLNGEALAWEWKGMAGRGGPGQGGEGRAKEESREIGRGQARTV